MDPIRPDRRQFLSGGLAAVVALALEACGSTKEGAPTSAPAPASTAAAATSTAAPATTAAPTTTITTTAVPAGPALSELAASSPDLAVLDAALKVAAKTGHDLLVGGPVTIFSPNAGAMVAGVQQLNAAGLMPIHKEQSAALGKFHIIAGRKTAADLAQLNGQKIPTQNGATITVLANGPILEVNGAAVVKADIEFSGGIIHIIDALLLPPDMAGTSGTPTSAPAGSTIADLVGTNPDLSLLAAGLRAAGLLDVLSGSSQLTLFAPSNAAFLATLEQMDKADQLPADGGTSMNILTYHVAPGALLLADIAKAASQGITTLAGPAIPVDASGPNVKIGGANVTTADFKASNGIIHVIDAVLVPPAS